MSALRSPWRLVARRSEVLALRGRGARSTALRAQLVVASRRLERLRLPRARCAGGYTGLPALHPAPQRSTGLVKRQHLPGCEKSGLNRLCS